MKKMMYRVLATDTLAEALTADTLAELFTATRKLDVDENGNIHVDAGKTATDKMQGSGFLARSPLATYAFGTLGFTNAITATALLAAVNYGSPRIFIGSNIELIIDKTAHTPQGDFITFTATARNYHRFYTERARFTLSATFTDATAEKKHNRENNRTYNRERGFIPLRKTENEYAMRFCENIYIGGRSGSEYDAFTFTTV